MPLADPTYPVSLVLSGKPCLVVGGGRVALHKAEGLARCAAAVTVIAPEILDSFASLARDGLDIELERRQYQGGEAASYHLVIAATGIADIDHLVFADAQSAGVLVNAADDLAGCSFILPAVLRRGPVSFAVSTGGSSPALASWLRDRLSTSLAPEIARLAELVSGARATLATSPARRASASSWRELFDAGLLDLLEEGRDEEARTLVDDFVAATLRGAPATQDRA